MLPILYNALWYPALPFALMAGAGVNPADWRERLGLIHFGHAPGAPRVWIHASSVGEIEAVRAVAIGLRREFTAIEIMMTSMTSAGRDAACRRISGAFACQLAPLDFPLAVRSFMRNARPDLLLIAETELWPNFFFEAARAGVRVAIVNGRVSARSATRYGRLGGLIATALGHADLILTQTEADAIRYRALGAPPERVIVTGNTKFDLDETAAPLRPALEHFAGTNPILVAGSTAPDEEHVVIEAYGRLILHFPTLALVIAPRHLNRADEIAGAFRAAGLAYVRASELPAADAPAVSVHGPGIRDAAGYDG